MNADWISDYQGNINSGSTVYLKGKGEHYGKKIYKGK